MDYYKVLGISRNATVEDIKKAYRELAKKYHPDLNNAKNAEYLFIQIKEAFEVLYNPESRQAYDIKMGFSKKWKAKEESDEKAWEGYYSKNKDEDSENKDHKNNASTSQNKDNNKKKKKLKILVTILLSFYLLFGIGGNAIIPYFTGIYIGEIKYMQPHGSGIYYNYNGSKYIGEWNMFKRHGIGTYYYSDGKIMHGDWNNDSFVRSRN